MDCSIIILNFFGEKVIAKVLDSLLNQNYPKNKFEIIVVDNASTDKSIEILKDYAKNHQLIKNIFLNKNFGFSKGNNFGIKAAQGKYVALLNNDCLVEPGWLRELIKVADNDKKIFAVNSKILLYPKYLDFEFEMQPSLVFLYSWLSDSFLYEYESNDQTKVYLSVSRVGSKYHLEIPFDSSADSNIEISLYLGIKGVKKDQKRKKIEELIFFSKSFAKIASYEIKEKEIEIKISINTKSPHIKQQTKDKIQNAGTIVFQNGYGRDIGAIIRANEQYYEYDQGQYEKEKNIYAACAAAVLYRKSVLEEVGFLDETFFMYYEDIELSERARFNGYKIVYAPKAVARHMHSLSSKEWSPFFVYNVEKGRLLHVFYNFPFQVFIIEYLKLWLKTLNSIMSLPMRWKTFVSDVKDKKSHNLRPEYGRRLQVVKVAFYFLISFPYLLEKKINKQAKRGKNAVNQNYNSITSGSWYLE